MCYVMKQNWFYVFLTHCLELVTLHTLEMCVGVCNSTDKIKIKVFSLLFTVPNPDSVALDLHGHVLI
jgi:hypothetical protein